MTGGQSGHRAEVRPSPDDRCAECSDAVGHEWVSYRQDPGDPQNVVQHLSAVVHTGPVEPRPERPKRTLRDFRHPEDLGVFFHSWCAPGLKLSEKKQKEIAKLLADLLIAEYRKTSERWARIPDLAGIHGDAPRCRAQVTSVEGRRVFMMTRPEWERFRAHEGKLVEIDLERSPAGSLGEAASAIASLTAEYSVHTERIEVWRYHMKNPATPENVHDYLILENLSRHVNVPMFAERASTQDSPKLRKHLREHVFIVKARPDKGRWEAKARALERIVFLST